MCQARRTQNNTISFTAIHHNKNHPRPDTCLRGRVLRNRSLQGSLGGLWVYGPKAIRRGPPGLRVLPH